MSSSYCFEYFQTDAEVNENYRRQIREGHLTFGKVPTPRLATLTPCIAAAYNQAVLDAAHANREQYFCDLIAQDGASQCLAKFESNAELDMQMKSALHQTGPYSRRFGNIPRYDEDYYPFTCMWLSETGYQCRKAFKSYGGMKKHREDLHGDAPVEAQHQQRCERCGTRTGNVANHKLSALCQSLVRIE